MKLLFVHQNLGDFGGAETFVRLAGTEFRRRDHCLTLLHTQATGRNEAEWRGIFDECFRLPSRGNVEMVEAVLDRIQPDLVFVNNWEDVAVLAALLNSGIPVVRMVHDHSLYCLRGYKYNVFTRRICTRHASAHCVFPCLGTLVRNPSGPFPVKWASYRLKKKEIQLNRRCTAVLAYSEYQRKELISNGFRSEQVHLTMPMRVSNVEGLQTSYSDRNLILFAGQIIRGKGVDALIRALAKVRVPFECIILGDGNHRAKCERLCSSLGVSDKVRFAGYVLPAALTSFYLDATVFAVSSLWPEPFGMTGPEAMRYGLPVVAFDAGAIGEWLKNGETGFLVPWNDTSAFAARLELLLSDKALARRLGTNGMRFVQRFDATYQMERLESLFSAIVSTSAKPGDAQAEPARPLTL